MIWSMTKNDPHEMIINQTISGTAATIPDHLKEIEQNKEDC